MQNIYFVLFSIFNRIFEKYARVKDKVSNYHFLVFFERGYIIQKLEAVGAVKGAVDFNEFGFFGGEFGGSRWKRVIEI